MSGQLTDTRTRFLGTKPPKLFAASVRGARCMLALSSRPWLGHTDQGRFNLAPLSYEALDYASGEPLTCRMIYNYFYYILYICNVDNLAPLSYEALDYASGERASGVLLTPNALWRALGNASGLSPTAFL